MVCIARPPRLVRCQYAAGVGPSQIDARRRGAGLGVACQGGGEACGVCRGVGGPLGGVRLIEAGGLISGPAELARSFAFELVVSVRCSSLGLLASCAVSMPRVLGRRR